MKQSDRKLYGSDTFGDGRGQHEGRASIDPSYVKKGSMWPPHVAKLSTTIPVRDQRQSNKKRPDSASHAPLLAYQHVIVPSLVYTALAFVTEKNN